jgi:hypothetical protein
MEREQVASKFGDAYMKPNVSRRMIRPIYDKLDISDIPGAQPNVRGRFKLMKERDIMKVDDIQGA